MAEWRNEITGGRFDGPVVQIGSTDQVIVHVDRRAPDTSVPPWASWAERPVLTPALRNLMEAQQRISEALPYELLNITPPDLVDVYVQQTVLAAAPDGQHDRKRQPTTERGGGRPKDAVERSLTVTDALNRNQHVVITGEPGAGKSTLGHMYVQALAGL